MQIFLHRCGISVVEAVIGISLIALVLLFVINIIGTFASFGRIQAERVKAIYLAQEVLEASRFMSDASWSTFSALTPGTIYYIVYSTSTGSMSATTAPQFIGSLTPKFKLSSVYRATADDDIVASTSAASKAVDASTRLVEASVTYGTSSTTVTLSQYLSDISP